MATESAARYEAGQPVRVREDGARGHVRTPRYVRGRVGRVVRVHGLFRNPESLAYGGDGLPTRPLYQVCFAERDHVVCVDLYEHWLDAA